jgi:lysostaphin
MPVSANQKPGTYALAIVKGDGSVLESVRITVSDAHFPRQNVKLPPKVQRLKPSPGEMETVAAFRNTVTAERRWTEPLDLPIPGCMTSPFGVRRVYNGKPSGNYHAGIDQASPAGTPIHAVAAGVVRLVREFNIHGHVIGVDHGQGLSSVYLHMSKFAVAEGKEVRKGDVIGYVGSTGRSTAPHLHWSLYANGVSINPREWVKPPACK